MMGTPTQEWLTRPCNLQVYWDTAQDEYRKDVVKHVSRVTPRGGTVWEVGCGPGVNLCNIKMARPDLRVVGTDVNPYMHNGAIQYSPRTEVYFGRERFEGPVDTILGVFSFAYYEPGELVHFLAEHIPHIPAFIFMEPVPDEPHTIRWYEAEPSYYAHAYADILDRFGGYDTQIFPCTMGRGKIKACHSETLVALRQP